MSYWTDLKVLRIKVSSDRGGLEGLEDVKDRRRYDDL